MDSSWIQCRFNINSDRILCRFLPDSTWILRIHWDSQESTRMVRIRVSKIMQNEQRNIRNIRLRLPKIRHDSVMDRSVCDPKTSINRQWGPDFGLHLCSYAWPWRKAPAAPPTVSRAARRSRALPTAPSAETPGYLTPDVLSQCRRSKRCGLS